MLDLFKNAKLRREYCYAEKGWAYMYLEQLNNGCNPLIEMLWKIVNSNQYKKDAHYSGFFTAIEFPVEYTMKSIPCEAGVSPYHKPERYAKIEILGELLADHIPALGGVFWCDGPLSNSDQEIILSHIRSLNKVLEPYGEFTITESTVGELLSNPEVDKHPERLSRTWLFMIKTVLELINKLVHAEFIAST